MRDEEYGHLAGRLVVEQNLARTALCCTAAAAHQGLADAYRARLQFLILSPACYRTETSSPSRQERRIAEPAMVTSSTNKITYGAYTEQGDLI